MSVENQEIEVQGNTVAEDSIGEWSLGDLSESDTEIVKDTVYEEKPVIKGEDIYVENDPDELDRMLGVAPSKEETLDDTDNNNMDEEDDGSVGKEIKNESYSPDKENTDKGAIDGEIEYSNYTEVDNGGDPKNVCLMDFMEEDPSVFSYLSEDGDSYMVHSLPIENKAAIKKAVRGDGYLFRYPKLYLKDRVLGFFEDKSEDPCYIMFFPEYSIFFQVPSSYKKPYSVPMKEYFEDLVSRIRPMDIQMDKYPSPVTITSLKVVEPGVIDVEVDNAKHRYQIQNRYIELFYNILSYVRGQSDMGMPSIPLSLIPKFFVEVSA